MSKHFSAIRYEEDKERLQKKKACERYQNRLKKKKKKRDNIVKVTTIS